MSCDRHLELQPPPFLTPKLRLDFLIRFHQNQTLQDRRERVWELSLYGDSTKGSAWEGPAV